MLNRRHIGRPRNPLRHMRPDRQRPQLCPPRLLLRTPRMLGLRELPQTRPSTNQGLRKHGTNPRIMEQPRGTNLARQVTPTYDRNGAQLYVGDCVEVMAALPAESVDAIVTSPPYAMQRKSTYGGIPESEYPAWTVAWMDE